MIKRFNDYITEKIENPIIDAVIDLNDIHNGTGDLDVLKGKKDKINNRVLGDDGSTYPAGIDKTGTLISYNFDEEGFALSDFNERIPIPKRIKKFLKRNDIPNDYWRKGEGLYFILIPTESTGWVNIKVDMEMFKRVKRYSKSIGTNTKGYESFLSKLRILDDVSNTNREQGAIANLKTNRIQSELSVIIILQHINEIKDFFNPSQAGFLFESFLSGLIPNSVAIDDNKEADIIAEGDKYQLKLVSESTQNININNRILDYYIIGVKLINSIRIFCISKEAIEQHDLVTLSVPRSNKAPQKYFKVKNLERCSDVDKFNLDLNDIEGKISRLGETIKENISDLYKEISEFEYNLETIVTGVDKNGRKVRTTQQREVYYRNSQNNIEDIKIYLTNFIDNIER